MSKMKATILPNGQKLYRGKNTGLIYYPSFPQPLQGTKQSCRPDFDITHPDDWPQWCKNMHTEHATIEVVEDGTVIWWAGTVHDGIWCGDEKTFWMGGCFRDGIWLGGNFINGTWITGEKRGGNFIAGTWRGGVHRAGYFGGLWLGGAWMGGEFNGFRERTSTPPGISSDV